MINVLVADDHAMVRAGLCRLLESREDIKVVGEAGLGREAVDLCRKLKPHVVLLDLDLPDIDGIEVTHQILSLQPEMRVLILTMHDSEDYAGRLIQAGAAGFIIKGNSPGELPDAVRRVAGGGTYITPSMMERMIMNRRDKVEHPLATLSDRELQVMTKFAQGKEIRDITEELGLSPSTVGTYKKRIFEKLGFANMADLIRFAIRQGIIKDL